ncbi:MAG: hypothetical protein AAF495_12445 [Pseudomonadota bacterium]
MTRPIVLWTVISILVLTTWLIVIALGYRTPEALFYPLTVMALMSFPLGPLAAVLVILLAELVGFHLETAVDDPLLAVLLVWVFFHGWGHLQWFIFIPAVRQRLRGS